MLASAWRADEDAEQHISRNMLSVVARKRLVRPKADLRMHVLSGGSSRRANKSDSRVLLEKGNVASSTRLGVPRALKIYTLFSAAYLKAMKKSVGVFSEDKLRELAQQDNVTVMTPTHDVVYEPWPAVRVAQCVDRLVTMTRGGTSADDAKASDADIAEFSEKYLVFFKNLTTPSFVAHEENVTTLKKMIVLRGMVENNSISETTAQAQSADIALKSLMSRVDRQASRR
jgi:hypothetical protein